MTPKRFFALVLLALVAASACGRYGTSYAAVVEGTTISFEDLDRQVQTLATGRGIQTVTEEQRPQLRREALVQLIQRSLVQSQVRAMKIVVEDADVSQRFDQVRSRFPDAQTFQQAMTAQGYTETSLRKDIKDQIGFEMLASKVAPVTVSDARVADAYEKRKADFDLIHARHILFGTQNRTAAQALAAARDAVAKIRSGTDFATLARQSSDDPGGAQNGGDLGEQARSFYDADFAKAAFALPLKTVSEPVKTQFGYHVIEVLSRRTIPAADARAQIRREFEQTDQQAGLTAYLEKIAKTADVEVNPRIGRFDPESLQITEFRFFSPAPGSPAPGLGLPLSQ